MLKKVSALLLSGCLMVSCFSTLSFAILPKDPVIMMGGTVVIGDLNKDGKINTGDLTMLRKIVLETFNYEGMNDWDKLILSISGDVNGDNRVNAGDYTIMTKYLRGEIEKLPAPNIIYSLEMDFNLDGKIDAGDFTLIKRTMLEGAPYPTTKGTLAYDLNKDGVVDEKDYDELRSKIIIQ